MATDPFIVELKAGSSEAFTKLVDDHLHKVINLCYRFVNSREEAEDLAQETFVEVYESLAGFRGDSGVATWIFRIAVRKSLDYHRKQNRQKRRGFFSGILRLDDPQVEVASAQRPDIDMETTERRRLLHAALASLPENQKTAFLLSKYDELSYQEIAGIMKTSVSAITALIHRAKLNLHKRLANYYEDIL